MRCPNGVRQRDCADAAVGPLLLSTCSPVRIINVASTAHLFGRMDFDDLMGEQQYDRWRAYGQSKLANILFTYELARRLQTSSSSITANCLHPGVVRTELPRWGRAPCRTTAVVAWQPSRCAAAAPAASPASLSSALRCGVDACSLPGT